MPEVTSNARVAIFLVTYNRLTTLQKAIESYRHLTTPYEIIIIDNDTDDPDCLEYLKSLPYSIIHKRKIYSLPELEVNIREAVDFYYEVMDLLEYVEFAPFYAVSDCDISFEDAPEDTLEVYMKLCRELNINVGPALRLDCIPAHYPLRNKAVVDSLYDLMPEFQKEHDGIRYINTGIDTTFCLFPKEVPFKRLSNAIRVYNPYWAHHLDWYIDIQNMTPDQVKYMNKKSPVGSSGGSYIASIYEDFQISPEYAFQKREREWTGRHLESYFVEPWVIAWMLQYGIGCEQNIEKSKEWVRAMIGSYGGHRLNEIPVDTYLNIIYSK